MPGFEVHCATLSHKMSKSDHHLSSQSWQVSIQVIERFLKSSPKLDELLAGAARHLPEGQVARVQFLSYGVVRNLGRLKALIAEVAQRPPKRLCQALLLVSVWEWLQSDVTLKPKVVHHAVERAKALLGEPESAFVNAVLRQMPKAVAREPDARKSLPALARINSHPEWLLHRFGQHYGERATARWSQWNQQIPKIYCHILGDSKELPEELIPTDWSDFYRVSGNLLDAAGNLLRDGRAYIQDPATRLGPSLIPGDGVSSILDLCAAPGGKSIHLLKCLKAPGGVLVSVDLPGPRFERMKGNLARYGVEGIRMRQIPADVLRLKGKDLPLEQFDCVFLDVPCSNSGVFQRRPDAKYRIGQESLTQLIALQEKLMGAAARFVGLGGRLIYSTCSIDVEENAGVVSRFLDRHGDRFREVGRIISLPWESGHDGCGAFALKRVKPAP